MDEVNVQGCTFLLTPSTLCLDVISRRKEVKYEGKFGCCRTMLVLLKHIPHSKGPTFFEELGSKRSFRDGYTGGEGRKHDTYVQNISLYWGMVYNTL